MSPPSDAEIDEEFERLSRAAPSRVANTWRNAETGARQRLWEPARDALWDFVAPVLEDGARVAVVGAGNGDDLPLRRIARRADSVALIDIDPRAARGARRRIGRRARRNVEVIGHDVTEGAADRIVLAAADDGRPGAAPVGPDSDGRPGDGRPGVTADSERRSPGVDASGSEPSGGETAASTPSGVPTPLPGAPYDLVIGDLFYSQLLYPALLDLGVEEARRASTLAEHGPELTRSVIARLHASAPLVVHVHDPLAWWDGHEQPVSLDDILALAAAEGPEAALDLVARGVGPSDSDPRAALSDLGLSRAATALWHWPFAPGVDYLACATLARSAPGTSA